MAKVSTEGKTTEEKMAMAEEISKGYFKQGLNCAECVFRTFADMHDINLPDEVITLTTGFGGGMAAVLPELLSGLALCCIGGMGLACIGQGKAGNN